MFFFNLILILLKCSYLNIFLKGGNTSPLDNINYIVYVYIFILYYFEHDFFDSLQPFTIKKISKDFNTRAQLKNTTSL